MDLVTYFIPVFFAAMGLEAYLAKKRGLRVYRHVDVVCDLSLGVLQVLVSAVFAASLAGAYAWVYARRLFDVPSTWWTFLLALVGIDFCYYWFHRFAHRTHVGWASHAPHHQSEDYNFAVALRQGPLQPFFSKWFYLPLALVGVSPAVAATALAVDTIAQFFVHTRLVDKLPRPLEWILNTPSHHRVHHGCDAKYVDRNHAGIFIVWDRLFGTFVAEEEAPTYGTIKPLASFSPVRATLQPFVDVVRAGWARRRVVDLVTVWLRPPEWRADGVAPPPVDRERAAYDVPRIAPRTYAYARAQFVVGLLATVALLLLGARMDRVAFVVGVALVGAGFATVVGLYEGRAWAAPVEAVRVAALAVAAAVLVA